MNLTQVQLKQFEDQGFLFFPQCFSQSEIDILLARVQNLANKDLPSRVLEKDSNKVRSLYGSHLYDNIFKLLLSEPRILNPVMQLLLGDVYVHQFKINLKSAFDGDIWSWHQDFMFWHNDDGMPLPQALTAAIFLDEIHEFNGPLCLIPKSHNEGLLEVIYQTPAEVPPGESDWKNSTGSYLKYALPHSTLTRMINANGIIAPKGNAGSVIFFHTNTIHGSVPNISPDSRRMLFISYNRVTNKLQPVRVPRPEFMAGYDFTPLIPSQKDVF